MQADNNYSKLSLVSFVWLAILALFWNKTYLNLDNIHDLLITNFGEYIGILLNMIFIICFFFPAIALTCILSVIYPSCTPLLFVLLHMIWLKQSKINTLLNTLLLTLGQTWTILGILCFIFYFLLWLDSSSIAALFPATFFPPFEDFNIFRFMQLQWDNDITIFAALADLFYNLSSLLPIAIAQIVLMVVSTGFIFANAFPITSLLIFIAIGLEKIMTWQTAKLSQYRVNNFVGNKKLHRNSLEYNLLAKLVGGQKKLETLLDKNLRK